MGITVYSLLWVVQDFYRQPYLSADAYLVAFGFVVFSSCASCMGLISPVWKPFIAYNPYQHFLTSSHEALYSFLVMFCMLCRALILKDTGPKAQTPNPEPRMLNPNP